MPASTMIGRSISSIRIWINSFVQIPLFEPIGAPRGMMQDVYKRQNSCSTIEEYKKLADKYDFEIVDTGINTSADIEIAASDLVSKVDCL